VQLPDGEYHGGDDVPPEGHRDVRPVIGSAGRSKPFGGGRRRIYIYIYNKLCGVIQSKEHYLSMWHQNIHKITFLSLFSVEFYWSEFIPVKKL
jgi:hypothetical protein